MKLHTLLMLLLLTAIVVAQSVTPTTGDYMFQRRTSTGVVTAPAGPAKPMTNVASYQLAAEAGDTIDSGETGIGWADGNFTLRTPFGAVQFSETGDPPQLTMTIAGRIIAENIDVTGMSLFTTAPTTSASPGEAGQMACDGSYFYVCTALNTWKRVAVSTW